MLGMCGGGDGVFVPLIGIVTPSIIGTVTVLLTKVTVNVTVTLEVIVTDEVTIGITYGVTVTIIDKYHIINNFESLFFKPVKSQLIRWYY